jgi:hypothetical protein
VQAGDAEHHGVNAVALQTAVAKDLPGLHPREDGLDSGTDLLVRVVVLLLPAAEITTGGAPVRDDQSGALVAPISDGGRLAHRCGGTRLGPRLAVIAVARHGPADGDDQAGVGVDDDLVVCRVAIVLRLGVVDSRTPYTKGKEKEEGPPCGVTYLRATSNSGPYELKASMTWKISWEGSDGTRDGLPDGTFETTEDVDVQEVQAINR